MTETSTQKGRKLDVLIYGTALAIAIVGGIVAIAGQSNGGDSLDPQEQARADEGEAEPAPETGESSFLPSLPDVPDLAAEPPPERAAGAGEPRLAQLGAEMRFLSRARELLSEHPDEAFAVLEQHRRAHPTGVLREEREAFAIEALVSLEQHDAAERRYYDFLRVYPRSELASRLETLMR